jgi:hypothetical protein
MAADDAVLAAAGGRGRSRVVPLLGGAPLPARCLLCARVRAAAAAEAAENRLRVQLPRRAGGCMGRCERLACGLRARQCAEIPLKKSARASLAGRLPAAAAPPTARLGFAAES